MRKVGLKLAVAGCLAVILFSSTTVSGELGEVGFRAVASRLFGNLHQGSPRYRAISFVAEKCFHLTAFAILAMLLWKITPDVPWKPYAVLGVGLLVGISSELLQGLFPGRDPTLRDVGINLAGTALGVALSMAFLKKAREYD